MRTSAKNYTKNKIKQNRKTDRQNPMVKAKLYSENHTKKHIHTTDKKRKRKNIYISLLPKSTASILGQFFVYSGVPEMQVHQVACEDLIRCS